MIYYDLHIHHHGHHGALLVCVYHQNDRSFDDVEFLREIAMTKVISLGGNASVTF